MSDRKKLPAWLRNQVFNEEGLVCFHCGIIGFRVKKDIGLYSYRTNKKDVYLSIDHIIPVSKGGTDHRSNLRVLCTVCNEAKGSEIEEGDKSLYKDPWWDEEK
jgi:5-methylcytosine-specific restriction endonuclease McrA